MNTIFIMRHYLKQLVSVILICLICMLIVTSCSTSTVTPQATHKAAEGKPEISRISMRLQWFPQYQFAGYIVALQKGYYTDVGLDVTLNPGGPDFVSLPLVASGSDTFGSTGADTILIAHEKDIPVVALATWFQASPVAFMVHSDSGIRTPQDFAGKRVGMFYGDNVETEYRALLAATHIDRSTIHEIPGDFNLAPFLSRRVDIWPVYATDQPHLARQQGADVNLLVARDYGVQLMGDVLFTTADFLQQNPYTTQAFVTATLRGWYDAVNNPEETITLIGNYNKELDRDHLAFEGQETIKLLRFGSGATCLGWNDLSLWKAEHELLRNLGIISKNSALPEVVQNNFIEAYYKEQGITCGTAP